MKIGNRLTWYLLLGVLMVSGLDVYLGLRFARTNLLEDLRHEMAAISRTLQVTLDISGDDNPERYFTQLAAGISSFENILGLVFYDREGNVAAISQSLQDHPLPQIEVRAVVMSRTPVEGMFLEGSAQRYYRIEPISSSTGEGIGAFLILEDFPIFTREFRGRALQTLLHTLALLLITALIVSVVVRHSIAQPLRLFTNRLKEIGNGPATHRLEWHRPDEIGELTGEFNRMCVRLEEAQAALVAEHEKKLLLERRLRHSEKLIAVGQVASRLAHEIGTPLNVIQMRAEQLLQRETQDEKDRAFLNVIVSQIERISGFIRQLLTLARRPELEFRRVHINEVVRRVVETIGVRDGYQGRRIHVEPCEADPVVHGDPDQLQQVLLNLTVNALQAVKTSGHVTLKISLRQDESQEVEVTVADTGPGIRTEDLSRIFDPFFTTKGTTGGTGLGLAISQEIVLNHRGEITVESELGKGSRFIVTLPAIYPHSV